MVNFFEFNLLPTDTKIVKKQALHGKKWRYFKYELYKEHVLKGTEPNWQNGEHLISNHIGKLLSVGRTQRKLIKLAK
jgi:hypothetical protein